MPVVLLIAAAIVVAGVIAVAMGRGGELAPAPADFAPLDLTGLTSTDVALLRPPSALWGYHREATDEALGQIARTISDQEVQIATLQRQLADLLPRRTVPGTGPAGLGPAGLGPAGTGLSGAGPAATGPMGTGPMGTGPMGTGPTGTGPTGTGQPGMWPSSTGPMSTGPSSTGPSSTGPMSTGPMSTGPFRTGPSSSGPAGPSRAGMGPPGMDPSEAGLMAARPGGPPFPDLEPPRGMGPSLGVDSPPWLGPPSRAGAGNPPPPDAPAATDPPPGTEPPAASRPSVLHRELADQASAPEPAPAADPWSAWQRRPAGETTTRTGPDGAPGRDPAPGERAPGPPPAAEAGEDS